MDDASNRHAQIISSAATDVAAVEKNMSRRLVKPIFQSGAL
jgi:hypothetical protein